MAENIKKIPNIGDSLATNGNVWFKDNYDSGNLVNVGQITGYGYLYIGFGIECRNGKYYSSSGINIKRSVFIFASEGIRIGTSSLSEIPIGTEVSLNFKTISE